MAWLTVSHGLPVASIRRDSLVTIFNMVGAFLAGLLAFSVALYVAVVGGVLAYHKIREGLRHRRAKLGELSAGRQAD